MCKTKGHWVAAAAVVAVIAAAAAAARAQQPPTSTCSSAAHDGQVDVFYTELDGAVSWMPRYAGVEGESETVYLITRNHTLYRSADDGRSWAALNDVPATMSTPAGNGTTTRVRELYFTADARTVWALSHD
eukprot:CAMPEP_0198336110 /NCGR_PEP_ID=MMETSP1450-20131203/20779_1 /TAXON_ID=753684 ORGANISM="Madagascaria erythrocladiodes, Strain CCMP3234" /NCGR_SAMPLE_ID=MMETSP1450 /ASSEMBLY_ACC=CAM_ASM_001115 /LENGTH=130 /DNA_ID=CAMNT_0044040821 /DNA_START=102 /DNA_END=491 /DNA_ORIENTATION=-